MHSICSHLLTKNQSRRIGVRIPFLDLAEYNRVDQLMGNVKNKDLEVISVLKTIKGIMDVFPVGHEHRKILSESEKSTNPKESQGIMEIRSGFKNKITREKILAAIRSRKLRRPRGPIIVWSYRDEIIGEEIWDKRTIEEMKRHSNTTFITEDYVVHKEKSKALKSSQMRNKEIWMIFRGQRSPEIEQIEGVGDVVSRSLSIESDRDLRTKAQWALESPDIGSIPMGYNRIE